MCLIRLRALATTPLRGPILLSSRGNFGLEHDTVCYCGCTIIWHFHLNIKKAILVFQVLKVVRPAKQQSELFIFITIAYFLPFHPFVFC